MDFETQFKRLDENNLRLNNLFQLKDGSWRANVRDKTEEKFYEFGHGSCPKSALKNCIDRALIQINFDKEK